MSRRTWLQPLVLGVTIIVSMFLGGMIATSVADERAPANTTAESPAVQTIAAAEGDASSAADDTQTPPVVEQGPLADLVEQVRHSSVVVEGGDGVGSGVVVDDEGHIVTNYHVVEGRETLKVVLPDGSASLATVLGSDPGSDLAVLQADFTAEQLTPATFGDSDEVRAGDPVFAIGTPFNQPFTVTEGIVSAVGRSTQSAFTGRSIRDVIQSDAAVNPGNSGGPLFNMQGEVIGINTSIENPNGRFFIGLGFAIPSNTALRYLPAMIAGETIAHPQLGVTVLPLDDVIAEELGLQVTRGVYVTSVQPGSAAERAGIVGAQPGTPGGPGGGGDTIVAIDGEPVEDFIDLARAIDTVDVGDDIELTVARGGAEVTLTATLQPWDLQPV
ncbi:MAG: trypsin-like peptidase domain-containing protein [Dehalococcoidia bacterium]